jgi:outer membrane protein OmpA-like peptidoglycan-associated protein
MMLSSRRVARWWVATVLLSLFGLPAIAQDQTDHPLLSHVAGTSLLAKDVQSFGVVTTSVAGKLADGTTDYRAEGRITKIRYGTLEGESPGEVTIYRNYLAAARQLGGHAVNRGFNADDPIALVTGSHVFTLGPDPHPPVAILNITNASNYELTIVEPKVMAQTVTAGQMAQQIQQQGHATLHIEFDTGKHDIRTDAQPTVREIVTLLQQHPQMKLSIEGHTDNAGAAAMNRELSLARAKAVMDAVVAQGISAQRLQVKGFGPDRPVADNTTPEGRAKNRRVELVSIK